MTRMRKLTTLSLSVCLLAACQPLAPLFGDEANSVRIKGAAVSGPLALPQTGAVLIKGYAQAPSGFTVKATTADVIGNATVTMSRIDGTPVAGGLTDSTGAFTLYQSTTPFTPNAGDFFFLDLTKRYTFGWTSNLLSLRTIVKWTGTSWTSVTGPTVVINTKTTAVWSVWRDNTSVLTLDETMGLVTVSGSSSIFGSVGAFSDFDFAADETSYVIPDLTANRDPLGDLPSATPWPTPTPWPQPTPWPTPTPWPQPTPWPTPTPTPTPTATPTSQYPLPTSGTIASTNYSTQLINGNTQWRITFTWSTSTAADSWLQYGASNLDSYTGYDATMTTSHSAYIDRNIGSGTVFVRCVSRDANGVVYSGATLQLTL